MCRRAPCPPLLLLLLLLAGAPLVNPQSRSADIELLPPGFGLSQPVAPVNYTGYQVLRILVPDNRTAELLRDFEDWPGVELWSENVVQDGSVDLMVSPGVQRELTAQLARSGASFAVSIDNVQAAIEQEKPVTPKVRILLRQNLRQGHPLDWEKYHRLASHHQYMEFIRENYGDVCDTFSLGTSSEGRDLKGVKCGFGEREIWMDGGIHAREWISPAVVSYLIREFAERSEFHQDILNNFTLIIVPILNPDGYEYSHTHDRMWRKTRSKRNSMCVGVDANRNFDISWGKSGTSRDPCAVTYGGPYPFSEPETRAVRDFVLKHKDKLEMFITFHSYSELLFVPFAFTVKKPTDYREVRRVAESGVAAIENTSGRKFGIPETTKSNKISGVSDDWAKAVAGIKYTYTFELRDKGHKGFALPPNEIEPSGIEIAAAVKAMIRALPKSRQYSSDPVRQTGSGGTPRQNGARRQGY